MVHCTGVEVLGPHFTKYHLSDHGVIHKFTERDVVNPHDHVWGFTTEILWGRYVEDVYLPRRDGTYIIEQRTWEPGSVHRVERETIHLLVDLPDGECWTHVSPDIAGDSWGFYNFRDDGIYYRDHKENDFHLLIPKL